MIDIAVDVTVHDRGFRKAFQSETGVVGRWLKRKAVVIEELARVTVGVDSGALLASIDSMLTRHQTGDLMARVGANPRERVTGYALIHHEGSAPHIIRARNAQYLRFPNRRTGRGWVYAKQVFHPGTAPNPFLTRFLREVI